MSTCQLQMPNQAHLYDHIITNAPFAKRMVSANSHVGKSVAICGAGPSLHDYINRPERTTHVWACNSALPYLMDQGVRVTHGFAIDQGEDMLAAHEWGRTFDVGYFVASSVHPTLLQHLITAGRSIRVFHSFLGIPDPEGWAPPAIPDPPSYEMFLYQTKYATSVQVGYGLNSVPRAICLALYMGFSRIIAYGADCACSPGGPVMPLADDVRYADWLEQLTLYADGRTAACYGARSVMAEAVIDGTRWHTRPDMVISARHLINLQRAYPGRIEFVGNTLVNAIKDKPDSFWQDMPDLEGPGKVSGFGLNNREVAA